MEQRLKQRLIGAVVLVALAVIFIPMLLQGPIERESTSVPIEIPAQPAVSSRAQPDPKPGLTPTAPPVSPVEPVAPPTPAQDSVAVQEPASTPSATPQPATVTEPKPVVAAPQIPKELASWAVQVGSFGTEANALGLRDSLRSKGYAAYTETTRSGGKTLFRVRVGPIIERSEAESLQSVLARKESLKGLVVPHP